MFMISNLPMDGLNTSTKHRQRYSRSIIKHILILFMLFFSISSVSAKEVRQETTLVEVPALTQSVTDVSNILTKNEHQRLTRKLKKLQSEHKVQMAVLILPTTGSDSVETFASRVFTEWKLGSKQRNDGILFLVASDDHKMRIAVGSGLKKQLTETKLANILRKDARLAFKEDDYYEGISNSIESLESLVKQSWQEQASQETSKITQAFEDDNSDTSDNISDKDFSNLLIFWLIGLISLPLLVFRKDGRFKRFLKSASTVAVCTFVLSLVGIFPAIPLGYYLMIFFLPVILILVVLFFGASLLGSLFSSLFGGLFGGSGSESPAIATESTENPNDDSFSGGGGKSDNDGASGDW
ncbi:uncharacterized protein BDD26_0079 [Xenorhabdus cabanillasii]|uniref:TPM domain-containing protein n=1 Tax=Xenorhabdus cabanillasii TaxID=351673 RepID=A0A3D9U8L4_9GAMM|nr:TPM domain-containing protein [Xenorhabdus cabanillasii]REF25586.1 uncharacterized protein BDD26_0079 [Xenorhabdus cabanillasii]